MAIVIQPYTEEKIPAVKAFNQRLGAGGVAPEFHFPESHIPHWLPRQNGRRIYQEFYLAIEGEDVRGAFILKHQDFAVAGNVQPLVYYHLPISEGIVNQTYANIGVFMLRAAMKMQPMLFALGMGGLDRPLPRILKATGWSLSEVPFFFRVQHPTTFLREIRPLRESAGRRALANIAAASGAGWLGIRTLHWFRTKASAPARADADPINTFGSWADELWQANAPKYKLIADRSSAVLNVLYPPEKNFICMQVTRGPETLGWAVVLDTQMRGNKYFGNLRVGTVADCFSAPENAHSVVRAATAMLAKRGVDLIVANHSHTEWVQAFRASGYLQGPSNFIFAASKPLAAQLAPFENNQDATYLMRGDGDGPVNL